MKTFVKFTEVDLIARSNRDLVILAQQHEQNWPVLRDILKVLKNRNPQKDRGIKSKAEAIAIVQPLFDIAPMPTIGTRKKIYATTAILVTAIFIGMFQGVGRDIWAHYSSTIIEFVNDLRK